MKYPMFKVHIDTDRALDKLRPVLDSGFVNEGEQVTELTNYFKTKFEHEQTIALNSCTSALTLALKLSNVGPGDEVIATSMTCVASNTPIHTFGAKVVWADIDHMTGNINPDNIEKLITPKTKALLCVNWSGIPCDLERIYNICENNNIKFIQDSAHSIGAMYKEKQIHEFAHYTCYSLQAIKHITTGDGGLLVVNTNEDDYKRAKALKWFGIDRDASKDEKGEWKGQRWEMDVPESGFKFHMNNITAAIGLSQIPHIDKIVNKHIDNGLLYEDLFSEQKHINGLHYDVNSIPSFWVYTLILSEHLDRDGIIEKLNAEGINAGLVHTPTHYYSCFKDSFVDLPETDYFYKNQISLPCGWWLNSDDIKIIAETLISKV